MIYFPTPSLQFLGRDKKTGKLKEQIKLIKDRR